MVKLSLISPKGNQGVRFFPHLGYLGLTPLKFEGIVRTQIEQDGKGLLAKDISIAVRCYESRHGRLGTIQTNILYEHSVTLWQKHDSQEWSEVGDGEYPFRLSVPSHVAAPSTALYFQEYRIFWRIEAVMNHIPISGVGWRQVKHFELPLVRYDIPTTLSPPTPLTPLSSSYFTSLTPKSRGPTLRYCVLAPPNPIGPLDIVSVQITVQPLDPSVSIRSASALVERRIHINDLPLVPPRPIEATHFTQSLAYLQLSSNHAQDGSLSMYPGGGTNSGATSSQDLHYPTSSSSVYSGDSSRPLLQHHTSTIDESAPPPCNDRGTTHIFAHAESSGRFSRDPSGVWRHNLTFSWPDTKSNSRWAVGETVQTNMATVKFFLRVKLVVSSPANTAETVELEDKELTITSTNDSQRQLALSQYSELVNSSSGRSKSKSPWRSKRDSHTEQLPSPPRSPPLVPTSEAPAPPVTRQHHHITSGHTHKISTLSSPYPGSGSHKSKPSRRPHTSAGPRDRSITTGYEPLSNQSNRLPIPLRPETARHTRPVHPPQSSRSFFLQKWVEAPRLGSSSSKSSAGHTIIRESPQGSLLLEKVNQVEVQAWEEELARIESASRRNSVDMRGFASQRKKCIIEPIMAA